MPSSRQIIARRRPTCVPSLSDAGASRKRHLRPLAHALAVQAREPLVSDRKGNQNGFTSNTINLSLRRRRERVVEQQVRQHGPVAAPLDDVRERSDGDGRAPVVVRPSSAESRAAKLLARVLSLSRIANMIHAACERWHNCRSSQVQLTYRSQSDSELQLLARLATTARVLAVVCDRVTGQNNATGIKSGAPT